MNQVIAAFKQVNGIRTDLLTGETTQVKRVSENVELFVEIAPEPRFPELDVPAFMRTNRSYAEPGEVFYTHHDLDVPAFMKRK